MVWRLLVCKRRLSFNQRTFSSDSSVFGLRGVDGHLPLAQTLWSQVIKKGEIVIDATCGKGNDSLVLSRLALQENSGILYCIDVQERAIEETRDRLTDTYGSQYVSERIQLIHASHETFPPLIVPNSISAIVYNLGYLPGSHEEGKTRLTTARESTIRSFTNALPLLKIGGILSATAYRGHSEGVTETEACERFFAALDQTKWRVFCHSPLNTSKGAILFSVCRRS